MAFTINGTNGLTFPDSTTQSTRGFSRSGDTVTGQLSHVGNGDFVMERTDGFDYSFVMSANHSAANKGVYFQKAGGGAPNGPWVFRGHVRKPDLPAFVVGCTTNGNIASGEIVDFSNMNGAHALNNGGHYSTANKRFTAPYTGLYWFSFSIYGFGGNITSVNLAKNGSYFSAAGEVVIGYRSASDNDSTVGYSAVISLTAGDYVQVQARPNVGTSYIYGPHSVFTGHFLG